MTAQEIAFIADLVRRRSGVVVDVEKTYLIESRLAPVARREGFPGVSGLIREIAERRDEKLIWPVVEAMASTETLFFRDRTPFDQLRNDILPVLARTRQDPIRVWSVGCATGQEPYSLAMLIDEERSAHAGLRVDLFASDLSERCLEKAHSGLYTQFEVQRGLPSRLLIKYFDKVDDAWVLSPRIRQMVRWRRMNLMSDLKGVGPFDVIFCRNVISAFEDVTRKAVLEQLASTLAPDGFLILGLSEPVLGLTEALRPVPGRRGLYVRTPNSRVAA
ncbi:MAG TPA: protein-glutamate O-methyltransferase CheR [Caulobacteraceae bacterium]|nr:protein-glutamate O-methyltransferase CheR [Caulobacteraceae bacterium]